MAGVDSLRVAMTAVVLEVTTFFASPLIRGTEEGVAQPKARKLAETTVSVPAKQLKRTADWRAMGINLSKWLKDRKEPEKSGEPPNNKIK
jgi:hypothetical protein